MSAILIPPVQGGPSAESILTKGSVRPFHLSFPTNDKLNLAGLTLQHNTLTDLLAEWRSLNTSQWLYSNVDGRVEIKNGAAGPAGSASELLSSFRFRIPSPIVANGIVFRCFISSSVPVTVGMKYWGMFFGNPDTETTESDVLDALGSGVGFITKLSGTSSNYFAMSQEGISRTLVDTGVTSGGIFEVISTSTGFQYFIDNVLVATITTNLPINKTVPMRVGIVSLFAAQTSLSLRGLTGATNVAGVF